MSDKLYSADYILLMALTLAPGIIKFKPIRTLSRLLREEGRFVIEISLSGTGINFVTM